MKTKEKKAVAKLAKAVKKIMAYKPPPGSLKKPEKIPSKAELGKKWKLEI